MAGFGCLLGDPESTRTLIRNLATDSETPGGPGPPGSHGGRHCRSGRPRTLGPSRSAEGASEDRASALPPQYSLSGMGALSDR